MSFTFDEKGHKYELDGKPMMGVTSVLGIIAKPALIGWAAKMTAEWIRENCYLKSQGTPDNFMEVFCVTEANLQEAVKAHTKKKEAGGSHGKDTHALVENYVKGCIDDWSGVAQPTAEDHNGLQAFAQWAVENRVTFLASEEKMYSKDWWTAGTADLILEIDGKRYIGDVKTQAKLWDNTPHIQCAAYAKMYKEMGKGEIDGTIIVLIPKETNNLTTHVRFALDEDIKAFEAALTLYKTV